MFVFLQSSEQAGLPPAYTTLKSARR